MEYFECSVAGSNTETSGVIVPHGATPGLRGVQSRVSGKFFKDGKTKADLIDAVYRRHGALTKNEAAEVVDVIFRAMKTTLQDGRSVRIRNFGAFEVTHRDGRTGVNPASGEKMFIPAHTGLTFKPSRNFKSAVVRDEEDER